MTQENNFPRHVAIIMDGNGRWAQEKRLPRVAGHHEGTKRVKEIVKAARELGLEAITFFAFSTENWGRPKHEVAVLLHYFGSFLRSELPGMIKNNIRFKVIGRGHPVPSHLLEKIRQAEIKTQNNTGLVLILAINYGGKQEIVDAAKKLCKLAIAGKLEVDDLDIEEFSRHLYTAGIPDPDLLIRTSGEIRLSNFLLWQLSYAEMYFPKIYWPDFKREEFVDALKEFQRRQRRFGNISATGKK
ncbi:MAG: isoprenyl transferase [Candidatus Omnitrophica bacterium]|nr:isoprenyl transferase [Candidatus Omnitrophota bacterium]